VPYTCSLPNQIPTVKAWNNKTFSPATGQALRLKPSTNIEAFFVCKVQKLGRPTVNMLKLNYDE